MSRALKTLLTEIASCRVCEAELPLGPRPVLAASARSRVLIAGQAPGTKVHASGVPWDDASGETLRAWLQVDRATFYDTARFAIVPMGFCYPGRGKSGDLPPRPECAATWHHRLMPRLRGLSLRLVIGEYAQRYHLGDAYRGSVTQNVRAWRQMPPGVIPLPHPSPRNRPWLMKNPFFEAELLPTLRAQVSAAILA